MYIYIVYCIASNGYDIAIKFYLLILLVVISPLENSTWMRVIVLDYASEIIEKASHGS